MCADYSIQLNHMETFQNSNCDNFDSMLKVQTFAITSFFIAQWAVKSWIIANPLEFTYTWQ